jgi:hypothetical protein
MRPANSRSEEDKIAGYAAEDTISHAEKTETDRPSIAEIKAIGEEAFIYGLPIVMN